MLLAIDIGNTNITLGIWDGRHWQQEWRLRTASEVTIDEYGIMITTLLREARLARAINQIIMSSVVPQLTTTFANMCQRYLNFTPLVVNSTLDVGIVISTENPREVGADRIVNAAAAYHIFHAPCIVIDMGTATTFDVVSGDGQLLGVAIAPGLRLVANALASGAAQLSQVDLSPPPHAIGRNTIHAMQSGLIFGYVALVEGMVARLKAEHPDREQKIHIIGTGGLIDLLTPHTAVIEHVDHSLTLTGLRVINDRITRQSLLI